MPKPSGLALDTAAIGVCALIWGTTWYAITLQFGVVDPVVSIVYRFTLASAVLFGWRLVRGEPVTLTRGQHVAALGVGLFTFALDYALVYWAEERVTSAVVAVMFAAMSFVNLIAFRLVYGERPRPAAWLAAAMGVGGVAILSWSELTSAGLSREAIVGIGLAACGVIAASVGNLSARRGDQQSVSVVTATAWAMAYGSAMLALFALATGRGFVIDMRPAYGLSLLYLSLLGSVVAFLLYFNIGRRRGYAAASYIGALTPPTAMLMSALFEGRHWGAAAYAGVALVLAGQWILLKARRD